MAHKIPTLIAAFLLTTQVAFAASATARASVTILEPVQVSLPAMASLAQASDALSVNSASDRYFDLSLNASDVCLVAQATAEHLAQASCETVTVNFN